MKKKISGKKLLNRSLITLGSVVGVGAAAVAAMLIVLSVTEFKPAETETLTVTAGSETADDAQVDTFRIMTWNIGYGALGDNADFFMDGGKMVNTASEARVEENVSAIIDELKAEDADVIFLQEVDRDSKRSHHKNEVEQIAAGLGDRDYSFANNFKVLFLPYPLPPIGKVDSGIMTLSRFPVSSAERVSLPCPFKWPVSMANLKRCLDVSRVDLEDGKQLVLVNLHLEAYDSGEGKEKQTKMLAELLQTEKDKGSYVIAGGDFNQIFSSADGSEWPAQEGKWAAGEIDVSAFEDGWQFEMDNSAPSCRSLDQTYAGADHTSFQYYLIDGFIVSDNIEVETLETRNLDFRNSDHNPVVMDVKLK